MPGRDPITIACAAGGTYALPLAAMLRSVLAHRTRNRPISIHIFESGLSGEEKQRLLRSLEGTAVTVHWHIPSDIELTGLPDWGGVSLSTYYRILLADVLPASQRKVLWLDADLIVLRDVAALYDLDISSHAAAAAQDLVIPFVSSRYGISSYRDLGLASATPHFNAGVMLLNLEWWRKESVARAVFDYLRKYRDKVCFHDQEGLNAVLAGQWTPLDPRWNQIASVAGRKFFKPRHLTPDQYHLIVEDPWIIHYAGHWKPWRVNFGPSSRQLFYSYLDQTAWAGWRPHITPCSLARSFYHANLRDFLYPLEPIRLIFRRRFT